MTDLFQRFNEDLQLRGMSERTIDMYVRAVRQLTKHYGQCPDKISDEQLRQYFLYNKNERKWSRTASTISLCGIKLFYTLTLKRDWTSLKFVRPEKEKKLPVVLSRAEVQRIFQNVRFFHHKTCLQTIYSLGLTRIVMCLYPAGRLLFSGLSTKLTEIRLGSFPLREGAEIKCRFLKYPSPSRVFRSRFGTPG